MLAPKNATKIPYIKQGPRRRIYDEWKKITGNFFWSRTDPNVKEGLESSPILNKLDEVTAKKHYKKFK